MVLLRPVDLSFLNASPKRWDYDAAIPAAPENVFAAISADPSTWTWFPGVTGGRYEGSEPYDVGTKREVRMGPAVYRETILAWDAPARWIYRVDEMTVPLAHALVEEWTVEPSSAGSTVRWGFAIDPRPLFRASGSLAPTAMGRVFRRAMRNLSATLKVR